jgi:hypothetical protein
MTKSSQQLIGITFLFQFIGTFIKEGKKYAFLLNASGIGILRFSVNDGQPVEYKYYQQNGVTVELFPKITSESKLKTKTLSRVKIFQSSGDETLDLWCH